MKIFTSPTLTDDNYLECQKQIEVFTEWAPMEAIKQLDTLYLLNNLRQAQRNINSNTVEQLRSMIDHSIFRYCKNGQMKKPEGDEYFKYQLWVQRRTREKEAYLASNDL